MPTLKKSEFEQGFDHCYVNVIGIVNDFLKEFKHTPEAINALRQLKKEIKRRFQ